MRIYIHTDDYPTSISPGKKNWACFILQMQEDTAYILSLHWVALSYDYVRTNVTDFTSEINYFPANISCPYTQNDQKNSQALHHFFSCLFPIIPTSILTKPGCSSTGVPSIWVPSARVTSTSIPSASTTSTSIPWTSVPSTRIRWYRISDHSACRSMI